VQAVGIGSRELGSEIQSDEEKKKDENTYGLGDYWPMKKIRICEGVGDPDAQKNKKKTSNDAPNRKRKVRGFHV